MLSYLQAAILGILQGSLRALSHFKPWSQHSSAGGLRLAIDRNPNFLTFLVANAFPSRRRGWEFDENPPPLDLDGPGDQWSPKHLFLAAVEPVSSRSGSVG